MGQNPTPQSAESSDSDINEAFEALRLEISLTRQAIEGLTATQDRAPD